MRSVLKWAVLAIVTLFAVTACGGNATSQPTTTPANPTAEATDSASLPSSNAQVVSNRLTFYDSYADW